MAHYAMVMDLTKCTGCRACTVACQMENQLDAEEHWLRVMIREEGRYPTVTKHFLTVQCMHCDDPPCLQVCPTGATYKHRDGFVLVDHKRCIGCKYCVVACPYQARVFNHRTGIPEKCVFCIQRVTKGVSPACLIACPTGARAFGDVNDPESEVSRLIARKKPVRLRPDLGTNPNIWYVR